MKEQLLNNKYISDSDFTMLIYRSIEGYFRLMKSYEIAKKLLEENCHNFFVAMNFDNEEYTYNRMVDLANKRNLDIEVSMSSLECSIVEVINILRTMCGLELSWLDEHRYIFESSSDKCLSYLEEEDNTLKFYTGLISNLTTADIKRLGQNISDEYILTLY